MELLHPPQSLPVPVAGKVTMADVISIAGLDACTRLNPSIRAAEQYTDIVLVYPRRLPRVPLRLETHLWELGYLLTLLWRVGEQTHLALVPRARVVEFDQSHTAGFQRAWEFDVPGFLGLHAAFRHDTLVDPIWEWETRENHRYITLTTTDAAMLRVMVSR